MNLQLAMLFGMIAMMFDLRTRKVPNALTYGTVLVGLLLPLVAFESTSVLFSVAGLSACFSLMFAAWLFMGIGGGDVKMAAAIGALLGCSVGLSALAYAYLIAFALALPWAIAKSDVICRAAERLFGYIPPILVNRSCHQPTRVALKTEVPMAGFYLAGVGCCWCWGTLL